MIATPSLSIANAALQLQVSAKVLSKRLDAVAEAIARVPGETLAAVLRYIEQMLGTRLEAVACLERQAFDSTPTDMRIPGEDSCQKEQRVKLYVVETQMALLLKNIRDEGDASPADFLLLKTPHCTTLRIGERGTAECIRNVLSSAHSIPDSLDHLFSNKVYRVSESDEDAGNVRCERLVQDSRAAHWDDACLHALCVAHKAHAGAEKTWKLCEWIISGIVHTYKSLNEVESWKAIKKAMRREISARLVVKLVDSRAETCTPEASAFRESCMEVFLAASD